MKILKYLFGILVLILVVFFALGLFTPSISYENQVTVNKTAKECWDVMSDESKLPEWITGFKRTELVSGTKNTVGAVSNVYIDENGEETVMKETITKVIPNKVMAMDFSLDFMNMSYEMVFDEKDGKTTVTSKSTTKGNGLFAKSVVALLKGSMKTQEDENLMKFKKLVDPNS